MTRIISNEQIAPDVFVMKIAGSYKGRMGQFYMMRADDGYRGDSYPLLSRPLSIHDKGDDFIAFLYRVHGRGTAILSRMSAGQQVLLEGPFGNGFPVLDEPGRIALVGGGMGIAPLLLAARHYAQADIYLGFSGEAFAVESLRQAVESAARVKVMNSRHRSILELLEPGWYDTILACGPAGMLKALAECTAAANDAALHDSEGYPASTRLYISTEKHMACGIGACLTCTVRTTSGNRRTCVEGPVFAAEEVDWNDLTTV
ncbi:dihydroorotate dehydrogenase electron transfer subunit [Paenibacillus bovis]|uniref:Dihydroorotate dehydrogenase electron transfer subunit n=1 Tax=Paenibacillus bovis TaxID=1616788 RepID=A0A172ZC66_9BACL|nr:dihydroorotate dehydrogenase electron transfer subunit [Paenibacillus bovis]ANF94867.1 dihydroorotate dehydrogenase electron transfer subunit [Paenibacillus bovis]